MKIAIISPSTKSLETLSRMLESGNGSRLVSQHEGGISKLRTLVDQVRPDVVIVEGMCHDAGELAPLEYVTAQYPHIYIIMLCTHQSPEMLLSAMRVGVREVLSSPASLEALDAAVVRAETKLKLRGGPRRAQVVAFMPCKGGSGGTFLAANLGHQLGEMGKKVLLIDLNLQFGEAVLTLHDSKAQSDIAQVVRNLARLDASFLGASVVPVSANFAILAAPDDPAQSLEIKPEHLDTILNLAINQYDFILLDVNRNLDDLSIKALDRANKVFLIMHTMLPHVRNAKRLMAVFRSLGYAQDKVEVLVNRYWKNGDIGLDELRASLGVKALHTVPNGYKDVARAVNLGVPLAEVSRSSPVYRAICELAEFLQPKNDEAHVGLLGRLLKH